MLQDGEHPAVAWTQLVIYYPRIIISGLNGAYKQPPQTYRHCFQEGGGELNSEAPYQIINRTGLSSLAWYGHNGIYVFTARVVTKDYR